MEQPRALLRRLSRAAVTGLERGARIGIDACHLEIGVGHLLAGCLRVPHADLHVVIHKRGVLVAAQRAIDEILAKAARRPAADVDRKPMFSIPLFKLVESADALALAHAPRARDRKIRTGHLLAAVLSAPAHFGLEPFASVLELTPELRLDEALLGDEDAEPSKMPALPTRALGRLTVIHPVAPGETLFDIARSYACDPEDIANENRIDLEAKLPAGARLVIHALPAAITAR